MGFRYSLLEFIAAIVCVEKPAEAQNGGLVPLSRW